jgi:hypothetical protein
MAWLMAILAGCAPSPNVVEECGVPSVGMSNLCASWCGPTPVPDDEAAVCRARAFGLAQGVAEVSAVLEAEYEWRVANVLSTPCETPGHYTGDVIWVTVEDGTFGGRGSYTATSVWECGTP